MNAIRVILADDHTIVRKGLRALLNDSTDIEVIAEAGDGHDVVEKALSLEPDVVLMDISMPLLNGFEATRRIKEQMPKIKIIMLTVHSDEEYIYQSKLCGADGYLVKKTAPAELVSLIQSAYQGRSSQDIQIEIEGSDNVVELSANKDLITRYHHLSNREREVLQLIAEDNSIQQIALILGISVKTVRAHRLSLMKKLDIHTTAGLTVYALQRGIISLDA